jgi:hypothetical protein
MRTRQDQREQLPSSDPVELVYRAWCADPRKVAWSQERYPQPPPETVLIPLAQAMWESGLPLISHRLARPRQIRRVRRRWMDTLIQRPFPLWRVDAARHRDGLPFTWESERDLARRTREDAGTS